jgi:hypothetical protein
MIFLIIGDITNCLVERGVIVPLNPNVRKTISISIGKNNEKRELRDKIAGLKAHASGTKQNKCWLCLD